MTLIIIQIEYVLNKHFSVFQTNHHNIPLFHLYIYRIYTTPLYLNKSDIISKIYYDPGGFGTMKKTLADAWVVDPSIKMPHVKTWFDDSYPELLVGNEVYIYTKTSCLTKAMYPYGPSIHIELMEFHTTMG